MSRFTIILWLILLCGIWGKWYYHVPSQKAAAVYLCARDTLVINHQIVSTDLDGHDKHDTDAYVGKYIMTAAQKGDTIALKDLASQPIISPVAKDSAIVILPLQDEEILMLQTLDVGSHIYLIAAADGDSLSGKNIAGPTPDGGCKVIAVHRSTAQLPGIWLWLQFPITSNETIAAFSAAQKRLITKESE